MESWDYQPTLNHEEVVEILGEQISVQQHSDFPNINSLHLFDEISCSG